MVFFDIKIIVKNKKIKNIFKKNDKNFEKKI